MTRLPVWRVVDVTLTKLDRFATRTGFQVPLVITSETTGPLNSTTRTKLYASTEEVAPDYASTTMAYKAAQAMFSQNPRPRQIKLGFVAAGVYAATPSPTFAAEMDALYAYDPDWYWLTTTSDFRDKATVDALFTWVDGKSKHCYVDSNDVATENPATLTSVSARNKKIRVRSGTFYHTDTALYPSAAYIAFCSRRDFDQPGNGRILESTPAYTGKFKRLIGITAINKASAAVQGVTGFVPAIGLDAAQGHFANTYVNIGGLDMVVEGNLLDGSFTDELHLQDWLIARTEEELLSRLANNAKIPYTNTGMQILVDGVEAVMNRAYRAGLVADYDDPDTGELLPAFEIQIERVEAIPASQRRNRIAPVIDCKFRISGAVHYVSARYFMTF